MEEMSGLSSLLRHLPTSKASTYMPKWIEQNQFVRFLAKSQPSGPIYEWKLVSCIVQRDCNCFWGVSNHIVDTCDRYEKISQASTNLKVILLCPNVHNQLGGFISGQSLTNCVLHCTEGWYQCFWGVSAHLMGAIGSSEKLLWHLSTSKASIYAQMVRLNWLNFWSEPTKWAPLGMMAICVLGCKENQPLLLRCFSILGGCM